MHSLHELFLAQHFQDLANYVELHFVLDTILFLIMGLEKILFIRVLWKKMIIHVIYIAPYLDSLGNIRQRCQLRE